jgi:integrase
MKDEQLIAEWLEECRTQSTKQLYANNIRLFQEWYGKPLETFLALDAKAMRHEALKFQSFLAERTTKRNGLMTANSIISALTALGSFCTFNDKTLNLRGKRLRTRIDLSSHVFTNGELSRLFDIGSVEEKAILATFCSLGWEVSSLLELKRAFVESKINQAKEEKRDFIYFQSQRPKTGALRLGVLNPLAIEWLSKWLAQSTSERLFRFTTKEGVNAMIKRLAREAHIAKTGRIHTHLIRKWVMSGLSRAGFNEFQIKYLLGKTIPLSDMTYLQTLQQEIETKYPKAYEYVNIKPSIIVTVVDETKIQEMNRQHTQEIEDIKAKMAQKETELAEFKVRTEQVEARGEKERYAMGKALEEAFALVRNLTEVSDRVTKMEEQLRKQQPMEAKKSGPYVRKEVKKDA